MISFIGIHVLVPLLGLTAFVLLCRNMRRTHIQSPPFLSWLVLLGTFGGWLMVCLTAGLVWQFALVAILVGREQHTLRWRTLRDVLWLRSPDAIIPAFCDHPRLSAGHQLAFVEERYPMRMGERCCLSMTQYNR